MNRHDDPFMGAFDRDRYELPIWRWGWLFRPGSMWVGVHYAAHNRRWCINFLPCVTLWITAPGGKPPR